MANIEISTIPKQQHDELCCSYATLLLHDDVILKKGLDISEQNLKKIIDASANKVEAQWIKLFTKALAGMNVSALFASTASADAPASSGSSVPEANKQSKKEEKVEVKPKEEPKEDEDMDMGDLFAF